MFSPHLPNTISQPALHSRTIDNNKCLMPGMACANLALSGSPGMSRAPSCVLCTCSPFVAVTVMGVKALCLYSNGAPTIGMWLLAPKSSIAHFIMLIHLVSSIMQNRFFLGLCHSGGVRTSPNIMRAALPNRDVWRFWCLLTKMSAAWLTFTLVKWSWFLNPYWW